MIKSLLFNAMSRKCQITNKGSQVGGQYSNRTRATKFNLGGKRRRLPNMQKKRVFSPAEGKFVLVQASARGLKTIQKKGVDKVLKQIKK